MSKSRVPVAGLDALDRRLAQLAGRAGADAARRAARRAAREVLLPAVRAEAPKGETGDLAESAVATVDKGDRIVARVVVGDETRPDRTVPFHAAAVEFGTRDRPPDGFLRRALDTRADDAKAAFADALMKELESVARK